LLGELGSIPFPFTVISSDVRLILNLIGRGRHSENNAGLLYNVPVTLIQQFSSFVLC